MVRIAPINLYYNPKTLWFDAGDLDVRAGDGVIVSTARGTEFGRAAHDVFEADEAQIKKLDRHKRLAYVEVHLMGRTKLIKVGAEIVRKQQR